MLKPLATLDKSDGSCGGSGADGVGPVKSSSGLEAGRVSGCGATGVGTGLGVGLVGTLAQEGPVVPPVFGEFGVFCWSISI